MRGVQGNDEGTYVVANYSRVLDAGFFFRFFFLVSFFWFYVSARVRERGAPSGCDYTLNETIASERFIPTVASRGDTRSGDDTNHHQSMSLRFAERRRVAAPKSATFDVSFFFFFFKLT